MAAPSFSSSSSPLLELPGMILEVLDPLLELGFTPFQVALLVGELPLLLQPVHHVAR